MANLISQAEALAKNPPLKVYKKLMELFSKAQLAWLETQPKDQYYNKTKEEFTAVASKWDAMVKDYGEEIAYFSVTAVCDFVAMCMMMIAAGPDRIEALKGALHGQKGTATIKTKFGDRACLLVKGEGQDGPTVAQEFRKLLSDWCKLETNGIVQFKFPADRDLHTFVVERAPDEGNTPEFVVYQGYQNTYSLAYFLGIDSSIGNRGDDVQELFHKKLWDRKEVDPKYLKSYDNYFEKVVTVQKSRLRNVSRQIGGEQKLNLIDLNERVIRPLADMLRVGLSNERYVNLTGSPTTSGPIGADYMIMLMCDEVSPAQFTANRQALDEAPDNLTKYAEYSPPQVE